MTRFFKWSTFTKGRRLTKKLLLHTLQSLREVTYSREICKLNNRFRRNSRYCRLKRKFATEKAIIGSNYTVHKIKIYISKKFTNL